MDEKWMRLFYSHGKQDNTQSISDKERVRRNFQKAKIQWQIYGL